MTCQKQPQLAISNIIAENSIGSMLKVIFKLIFWSSIVFLCIALWTLTFGQVVPYEFRNMEMRSNFYDVLLPGAPAAVLFTLFGSLKKSQEGIRKASIILFTTVAAFFCFYLLMINLFNFGFGAWSTFNIAYEHKMNPERQIREQQYDMGALGYGGWRIVEVKPFAGLFFRISPVDTAKIKAQEWLRVDKEGDVKFP
jgi:hypothetical protein